MEYVYRDRGFGCVPCYTAFDRRVVGVNEVTTVLCAYVGLDTSKAFCIAIDSSVLM